MTKSSRRFLRGMGLGVLAGMTAGVTVCCCFKRRKCGLKRRVGRALRNMSELVENVGDMF